MNNILLYTAATLLAATGNAAVISNSSCATSSASISNPTSCSAGNVSAASSATYTITGNTLTVATYDSTAAAGLSNTSTAASSINLDLLTPGDDRLGFVLVSGSYVAYSAPGFTSASAAYTLGQTLKLSCASSGAHSGISSACYNDPSLQTIDLGTDLDFIGDSDAQASASLSNGSAIGALSLTFQFFEADGKTPVDISTATPEPAAFALIAVGLAGILVKSRLGQRSSQ